MTGQGAPRLSWRDHQARTGLEPPRSDSAARDYVVLGCSSCAWRASVDTPSTAGYAEHLRVLGAPDFMVRYWQLFAGRLELPWGQLDREQVARVLFCYPAE